MKTFFLRFFSFSLLLLLAATSLPAQQGSGFQSTDKPILELPKTDFGLQFGTSFTTAFGGSSLFSQSFAPHFQWNPAQRFSLVVGSVFSTGQFSGAGGFSPFGLVPVADAGMMPQRLFSGSVYALGAYQLNERLTLTGGTWFERNNLQMAQPQMNQQALNMSPRGMMVGFDYRVTENFRFGAQLNVSQGYNPFNPFNQYGGFNHGLFAPSPFHRNTIW